MTIEKLRNVHGISSATGTGFLFVFKAWQQAHSWLRNCCHNTEDGQKDKPVVEVISCTFLKVQIQQFSPLFCVLFFICIWAVIFCYLFGSDASAATQIKADFVNKQRCITCHAEQAKSWLGSDHEKAMQVANEKTVLANFDNLSFTDAGVTSRFFKKGKRYFVNTIGENGQYADFEVKYTFGVKPLQQYLLQLPKNKLQAFTVAWDTEKKQWFDLYPNEKITPGSPLHWTGRAFTANSSCMECHMTNMSLKYVVATSTYHTTWSEVNVSCQSCHGPGSEHVVWSQSDKQKQQNYPSKGLIVDYPQMSPQKQVESCARCHSRRFSVSKNDAHGRSFFDDFMPELLREGVYHSDGQILDEVYVYGSFVQSKMYQKGVQCMDCHDPHSLKVRAMDNSLCVRCHQKNAPTQPFSSLKEKSYNSAQHHFHAPGSSGALCVNCHMPETTYMQVDPRRDHSFSIPRPDISAQWGVPNACIKCHSDKANSWAVQAMDKWYGQQWQQRPNIAATITQARYVNADVLPDLIELIKSPEQSAIVKATALDLLPNYGFAVYNVILDALADNSPLVRSTALMGLDKLPEKHRFKEVIAMLNDPVQGVRIEAARVLAGVPKEQLNKTQQQQFKHAIEEYKAAQMALNDHPEGYLNLGNLYANMRLAKSAEQSYQASIARDAYFAPAYAGLANLYYATGRKQEAAQVFRKGLQFIPEAGHLHYSLALLLVEQQQLETAAQHLKQAASLMPQQSGIYYNYGLLLQRLHKVPESEKALLRAYALAANDKRVIAALAAFYQQQGKPLKAEEFINQLRP